MLLKKEHFPSPVVKMELGLSDLDQDMQAIASFRSCSKNKRRFNDEQIKSLEVMFESDSRPDSVIKQQLANDLRLQPRQIAIWFQNRRARTKAKQIERDYSVLKESYDALSSSHESLKRENQSLRIQLQKLKSKLETEHENRLYEPKGTNENRLYEPKGTNENSGNKKSENESAIFDTNEKVTVLFDDCCVDDRRNVVSSDEDRMVLGMIEAADGSLTSSEKWCSFESKCLLDETSCSSNWWEYW